MAGQDNRCTRLAAPRAAGRELARISERSSGTAPIRRPPRRRCTNAIARLDAARAVARVRTRGLAVLVDDERDAAIARDAARATLGERRICALPSAAAGEPDLDFAHGAFARTRRAA